MSRHALPYRAAASSVVSTGNWQLVIDDEPVDLPEAMADWDYRLNLALQRTVTVDMDLLRRSTGLPDDSRFTLAVIWSATGSGLKAAGQRVSLAGPGTRTISLDVHLPGTQLGGQLTLDTTLVLAEPGDGLRAAPRRAGSVLWNDQHRTRLQGDAPQFPIAVVDFAKTNFPEGAGWYVQITGDFMTATMGALLLLINERKKGLTEAFGNAAKPRPVDTALLSAVYADVARTMVEHALREPDFDHDESYPDESLGATLQNLVGALFPDMSLDHLRRRFEQSPNLFATELQDAVRIFEDVR